VGWAEEPVPSIEEKDFCKRSNVNKSREVAVCVSMGILHEVADAGGEVYNAIAFLVEEKLGYASAIAQI